MEMFKYIKKLYTMLFDAIPFWICTATCILSYEYDSSYCKEKETSVYF